MPKLSLPTPEEYAPFYAEYIRRATERGDVISALSAQLDEIKSALGNLTDDQVRFKPAPQEWTIKEVIGHLNDVERVFSYRLLRISRNDSTPLSGFEQEDYVRIAGFDAIPIKDLLKEFEFLRRANLLLINNLSDSAIMRIGSASGASVSARALVYMLAGHVEHHMASLREKYLPTP